MEDGELPELFDEVEVEVRVEVKVGVGGVGGENEGELQGTELILSAQRRSRRGAILKVGAAPATTFNMAGAGISVKGCGVIMSALST